MKEISLGNQLKTLVDNEDFEWLSQWKWQGSGRYVYRQEYTKGSGERRTVYIHKEIMVRAGLIDGHELVDHIDQNKMNNQKVNLRVADKSKNGMNRGRPANNTTGYKGVYVCKDRKSTVSFEAYICAQGKTFRLGHYGTPEDAAQVYNIAAKLLHGEFAVLNDIPGMDPDFVPARNRNPNGKTVQDVLSRGMLVDQIYSKTRLTWSRKREKADLADDQPEARRQSAPTLPDGTMVLRDEATVSGVKAEDIVKAVKKASNPKKKSKASK